MADCVLAFCDFSSWLSGLTHYILENIITVISIWTSVVTLKVLTTQMRIFSKKSNEMYGVSMVLVLDPVKLFQLLYGMPKMPGENKRNTNTDH